MKKALLSVFAMAAFAFASNAQTVLISNDFDGSVGDWTVENLSASSPVEWTWANLGGAGLGEDVFPTGDNGSVYCLGHNSQAQHEGHSTLTSPAIQLSGSGVVGLSFYQIFNTQIDGIDGYVNISNDGQNWTTVSSFTDMIDASIYTVDLTGNVAGWSTLYVQFEQISTYDNYWIIDDVTVFELSAPNEIVAVSLNSSAVYQTSPNPTLSVDVFNYGSEAITSWEAEITVNGVSLGTEMSAGGTNIASLSNATIQLSTAIPTPTFGSYDVEVEFTTVNGVADGDDSNNSVSTIFYYVDAALMPSRKVVLEEGTGTWCGWCPRGTVAMEYMADNFADEAITIAVHNGDVMTIDEYDGYFTTETGFFSGFPAGSVDRVEFPDPSQFEAFTLARLQDITPVSVEISSTWDGTTQMATFDVEVTSAAALQGDYGIAVIITEDGITGTTGAYAQANYYAGGTNGQMVGSIDWSASPNPVPASMMVYDHVAVAVLGTPTGVSGVIPSTMVAGVGYTTQFTYTVPSTSDASQMHAVAMVVNKETHEILNAQSANVAEGSGIRGILGNTVLTFPNPANDAVNFVLEEQVSNVSVSITNNLGQVIATDVMHGDSYTYTTSDLAAGVYMASFVSGDFKKTVRFTVEH